VKFGFEIKRGEELNSTQPYVDLALFLDGAGEQ
jgi:hypothetical protein